MHVHLISHALMASFLPCASQITGHRGCVNRLAWHEEGRYLASVSDDRRCLIWDFHSSSASSSSSLTDPQSSPTRALNGGDQFAHMNPSAVIYTGMFVSRFVLFLFSHHISHRVKPTSSHGKKTRRKPSAYIDCPVVLGNRRTSSYSVSQTSSSFILLWFLKSTWLIDS